VYDDTKRLDRDFSRGDGQGGARAAGPRRQPAGAGRVGGEPKGASSGGKPFFRPAGNCVCTAPTSSTTATSCSTPKNFQFLWVVDFPMFEWNDEDNRWVAAHSSLHLGAR